MSKEYRVVDCRPDVIDPVEIVVTADTPEHAARLAIGEDLARNNRRDVRPRARVYFRTESQTLTMVRLYSRAAD